MSTNWAAPAMLAMSCRACACFSACLRTCPAPWGFITLLLTRGLGPFSVKNLPSHVCMQGDGSSITVQPGLIAGEVNRILAAHARKNKLPVQYKIGPDPSSIDSCMIGGIVANNSSGMCCGVSQNTYHTLKVCVGVAGACGRFSLLVVWGSVVQAIPSREVEKSCMPGHQHVCRQA